MMSRVLLVAATGMAAACSGILENDSLPSGSDHSVYMNHFERSQGLEDMARRTEAKAMAAATARCNGEGGSVIVLRKALARYE